MTSYTSPFGKTYQFSPQEVKDAAERNAAAKAVIAANPSKKAKAARLAVAEAELIVAETAHIMANGPRLWNESTQMSWSYTMRRLTATSTAHAEKMQKAIADSGMTYAMRWYCEDVMLEEASNDLASRLATMTADKTPSQAIKVMVNFQKWVHDKVFSWYPSRSTSVVSNLAEDQQHKALVEMARQLQWALPELSELAEAHAITTEQN